MAKSVSLLDPIVFEKVRDTLHLFLWGLVGIAHNSPMTEGCSGHWGIVLQSPNFSKTKFLVQQTKHGDQAVVE